MRPRRSARMTHFCSLRLTHTKNTFCRRARNGASDIIHAEGVRGDFPSSAPKARNPLTSHEEAACAGEGIDGRRAAASLHSICRAARKALLPGGKTPPNWRWWRVTFGEQSRVISPECRRDASTSQKLCFHLGRLRNRCAHIKLTTGDLGFSHFGAESDELVKALPTMRCVAVKCIGVNYPNSPIKFSTTPEEMAERWAEAERQGEQPIRVL